MKVGCYSIMDSVAKEFGPIFQAKNDDVAYRNFNHFIDSQKVNRAEYVLYRIFTWDTEEGSCDFHPKYAVEPSANQKEVF